MPRKRRNAAEREATGPSSPTQEDEADVLAEVKAKPDESGDLIADEEDVLEAGAVDAETIRENRRVGDIVAKHRGNVKGVPFNVGDVLHKYAALLELWPANTIDVQVKRTTGTPVQHVIISRPRSGAELYDAIMKVHGTHEEAEYEIRFFDTNGKRYRGIGRITMPDTRAAAPQGQPMQPFYPGYPPGYPPPPAGAPWPQPAPGYPPPAPPPPGYPPTAAATAPASQPMPQQPPVVVQAPGGPTMESMLASFKQMHELMQTMQGHAPGVQPPPQQPPAAPPPPSTLDPQSMMAWMRQMYELVQSMTQPPAAGAPPSPPPPQTPPPLANPMMAMMPPFNPPPGTMWVPGFGFIPVEQLMQVISGAPPSRPMMGRPQGAPGGWGGPRGPGAHRPPEWSPPPEREPPPAPRSPKEQFQDAMTIVRSAVDAVQEFSGILPQSMGGGAPEPAAAFEEDDSPVRVIDTGPAKIVVNKADGRLRFAETSFANMDKILKWMGEQGDKINERAVQRRTEERRQLPPGYAEVGPGYQPPPGMVAVQVDPESFHAEQSSPLPPPPTNVPPPIQSARRAWGSPTSFEES